MIKCALRTRESEIKRENYSENKVDTEREKAIVCIADIK